MERASDSTGGKGQSWSSVWLSGVNMKSGGFGKQWEEAVMGSHSTGVAGHTGGAESELTHTLLLLMTHSSQAAFNNRTKTTADTASGLEHL